MNKNSLKIQGTVVCGISTYGEKPEIDGRYRFVAKKDVAERAVKKSGVRPAIAGKERKKTLLGVAVPHIKIG